MRKSVVNVEGNNYLLAKKRKKLLLRASPAQILVLGFAAVIFTGAILLMLPIATAPGEHTDFLTSLFISTSAVCVTGLVVVDTGTHWSTFGQAVIMLLIQVGGLGFMTMATLFFIVMGRRIGLRERLLIQESLNQINVQGIVGLARKVLIFTFGTEALFAALMTVGFARDFGWGNGLWLGVFHAVSAFNNAGFDLLGEFRSLTGYVADPIINLSVTTLIILGGLGFSVVMDLSRFRRTKKLSVHSKMVLLISSILILGGMVIFSVLEWSNVLAALPLGGKLWAAYFQGVAPRTAGFNTVDIAGLKTATQFLIIILMFIGASPGSTGGGIKTTTFGLLATAVWSLSKGREDVELFRRRIPAWQVYKALAIVLLGIALVTIVTLILSVTEKADFLSVLFETVSAFATVGLSMGLTPKLSEFGKVLIILTMFAGRLGPLTLAFALTQRRNKNTIRYPEEKILVG